jgi:energy-coupling factor transport system ATP-binding protein
MALTLEGVSAHYAGYEQHQVLSGVDLAIGDHGCLAVVGPSGSGKSTLGRVMNGLLRPAAGRVLLDGSDLHNLPSLAEARRRVGLLMQQPDNQLFGSTVGEDIRFGPQQAGLPEDECLDRMAAAMARVGLDHDAFVARSPFSLSGGERRRVALAGLLAMRPQHLVLDEPIAGLDPAGRASIEAVIAEAARELSVILLTADLPLALRLAERVVLLDAGGVAFDGTPSEAVVDRARLAHLRLIVPVQVDVLEDLRARGAPIAMPPDLRPATILDAVIRAVRRQPAAEEV